MDEQHKLPATSSLLLYRYFPNLVAPIPPRLPETLTVPVLIQCVQHSDRISLVLPRARFGSGHEERSTEMLGPGAYGER